MTDMKEMKDTKMKDVPNKIASTAKEGAEAAANTVTDFASEAKDRVSQWASEASDSARQAFDSTTDAAKQALSATSESISNFGTEVTDIVKRYPVQAVLVGFGVGLLIGRTVRST